MSGRGFIRSREVINAAGIRTNEQAIGLDNDGGGLQQRALRRRQIVGIQGVAVLVEVDEHGANGRPDFLRLMIDADRGERRLREFNGVRAVEIDAHAADEAQVAGSEAAVARKVGSKSATHACARMC